jgi:GTPase SAR1 family protein
VINWPKVGLVFLCAVKYPVRNLLLETAIKRVLNGGRMMVVRQRQRIERLRNLRCSTHSAEQTLQELENSLAIFETHERELKERFNIRQPAKPP